MHKGVGAEDEDGASALRRQRAQGVEGVGLALAFDLQAGDAELGVAHDGELAHAGAVLRRGDGAGVLHPGPARGDEQDFV